MTFAKTLSELIYEASWLQVNTGGPNPVNGYERKARLRVMQALLELLQAEEDPHMPEED